MEFNKCNNKYIREFNIAKFVNILQIIQIIHEDGSYCHSSFQGRINERLDLSNSITFLLLAQNGS